jgi:hypothetical protein
MTHLHSRPCALWMVLMAFSGGFGRARWSLAPLDHPVESPRGLTYHVMHDICHTMIMRTATGWLVMPTLRQLRKIRSVVELSWRAGRAPWSEELVVEHGIGVGLHFLSKALEERAAKRLQGGDATPPHRARRGHSSRG